MVNDLAAIDLDYKELLQGCAGYIEEEKRDVIYKIALRLISEAKWMPEELTEAIGILLLTWNSSFYTRYGSFDFDKLEDFISRNVEALKSYCGRDILSYSHMDDSPVQRLFAELMETLKSVRRVARTPVGTAKALHLLAPRFFSFWDDKIAEKYGVYWGQQSEKAPQSFIEFQNKIVQVANGVLRSYQLENNTTTETALKNLCEKLYPHVASAVYSTKPPVSKSLVKMIDEYNYAKYTMELDLDKYRPLVLKALSQE